nr:hypothetical protein [Tanacetum cinerariifolium]
MKIIIQIHQVHPRIQTVLKDGSYVFLYETDGCIHRYMVCDSDAEGFIASRTGRGERETAGEKERDSGMDIYRKGQNKGKIDKTGNGMKCV